jgi:hypothetical protein
MTMLGALARFAWVCAIVALFGCSKGDDTVVPGAAAPETLSVFFQDGVSPVVSYRGTEDAVLKNGPTNEFRNGNFGTMEFDTVGVCRLGERSYERRLIVRMDLSRITNCSKVLAAKLSLRVVPPAADAIRIEAHRVDLASWQEWIEGTGGVFGGVSWTTLDGTAPWKTEGGDYEALPFDQTTASTDSTLILSLPPSVAAGWIEQPGTNHGIIVKAADAFVERPLVVFMREYGRPDWRPRFDLTYIKGG